jgi:hypothetical protein
VVIFSIPLFFSESEETSEGESQTIICRAHALTEACDVRIRSSGAARDDAVRELDSTVTIAPAI